MKKKLLSGVQQVIFLAFVTACMIDYRVAKKEGMPPYLSLKKQQEVTLKNKLLKPLYHNNLVGEFYLNDPKILSHTFMEAKENLRFLIDKAVIAYFETRDWVATYLIPSSVVVMKNKIYSYLEKKDIHLIQENIDIFFQNSGCSFQMALVDFLKDKGNQDFAKQVVQLVFNSDETEQYAHLRQDVLESFVYSYTNVVKYEAFTADSFIKEKVAKEALVFVMDTLDFEKNPRLKRELLHAYFLKEDSWTLSFFVDKAVEKGAIFNFSDIDAKKFLLNKDSFVHKHFKVLVERDKENFLTDQFADTLYWAILHNNQEKLQLLHDVYQDLTPLLGMILNIFNQSNGQEIAQILPQVLAEVKKLNLDMMYHYEKREGSTFIGGWEQYQIEELLFQYAYEYKHPVLQKELLALKEKDKSFLVNVAHIPFKNKDIPMIRLFLEKGIDKNTKTGKRAFSTFYEVYSDVFEEIDYLDHPEKRLLEQDFLKAIQTGDVQQAQRLINKGADVNKRYQNAQSALHQAVLNKDIPMVQMLLNKGADVMARNKAGVDSLLLATYLGETPLFKLIYEAWTEKERQIEADKLAKMARTGYYAGYVVETCGCGLRHYVYLYRDELKPLSLHFKLDKNNPKSLDESLNSRINALFVAIYFGYQDIFDILMSNRLDVTHCVGEEQESALVIAVQKGHEQMVRRLLDARLDPNDGACNGNTPLKYAISNGHNQIAKLLVERGAKIETRKDGVSALGYASYFNNKEMVAFLLEKGKNLAVEKSIYEEALSYAKKKKHQEIVDLLMEYEPLKTDE